MELGPYLDPVEFAARWGVLARRHQAHTEVAGVSVEGRPILRHDFGSEGPVVLLTALLHGIEVVGSHALLGALERLLARGLPKVRLVVLPVCNPDAYVFNMARVSRGEIAWRRGNARGVDLNRNFPQIGSGRSWHPFSGSTRSWSPHYVGPAPLSEPESRTIVEVARAVKPRLALGFHSFGQLMLYPWAHTRAPHPQRATYVAHAHAFTDVMRTPYRVGQATSLYPTIGDLDDYLDAELGTLAFTVEVGMLDRRLLHPRRAINPFAWMNPSSESSIERTCDDLARGMESFLQRELPETALTRAISSSTSNGFSM
ncbi:MAG: M14 family metallopeptidase [Polyangiales bacterium]